jgi:hypothetical protein
MCAFYYDCSRRTYQEIYLGLGIIIALLAAAGGLAIWRGRRR